MADLEQTAREAEQATLDIDEVAADALEMPSLPAPALTLANLDQALNHPGILPPGLEWRRLDAGSYALRLPGMDEEVRVTTQAEVFDDHFESHEFLSPGGQLFEQLAPASLNPRVNPPTPRPKGTTWMVSDPSTESCRFFVRRGGATVPCNDLNEILKAIDDGSPATSLDPSVLKPREVVHAVA